VTVIAQRIPDVKLLEPRVFSDDRGSFFESFNARTLAELGIDAAFVQDNHSRSIRNVLRGLHYQIRRPQGKLVRVVVGEVLDVAVDLRRGSPTFGQHVAMILSSENRRISWIPPGFAHGFLVRSDVAEFVYKASDYYAPQHERSLLWSDPELGIDWQAGTQPILSAKDAAASRLANAEVYL
jgi:dTDP-4-dehydrorhamnose 3,5-epimerase